jgi:hypothetical protein
MLHHCSNALQALSYMVYAAVQQVAAQLHQAGFYFSDISLYFVVSHCFKTDHARFKTLRGV